MTSADEPTTGVTERSSRSPISVAILAALAFMPIVVATGFLTGDPALTVSVPGDISLAALRGPLDREPDGRPGPPAGAGG